jgi:serine/threonine protein phosphatase PrpC
MITVKDTQRAIVQVCFDGSVRKVFRGPKAMERFTNEVRILRHLERAGCDFVPRVLSADPEKLLLITTNCGSRVDRLDPERCCELFAELEAYGVRHDDPEMRNVTYRQQDGRFCLIDFEFASLLTETKEGTQPAETMQKPTPMFRIDWWGCSDKGPFRTNNEDSYLGLFIDPAGVSLLGRTGSATMDGRDLLFAVSDGMGGAKAGEFASKISVDKITRRFPPLIGSRGKGHPIGYRTAFEALFEEINKALRHLGESYEECQGMGATLSLCWFTGQILHFAHIGDSRIYRLPSLGSFKNHGNEGQIRQLTEDDTHVAWLLKTNRISASEAKVHPAKNRLQKALGAGNQFVNPQVGEIICHSGDRFLLCTDGITDGLSDQAIAEALEQCPKSLSPAEHLVREAVRNSGKDNATAVIVSIS